MDKTPTRTRALAFLAQFEPEHRPIIAGVCVAAVKAGARRPSRVVQAVLVNAIQALDVPDSPQDERDALRLLLDVIQRPEGREYAAAVLDQQRSRSTLQTCVPRQASWTAAAWPTPLQLAYLRALGYTGAPPRSWREAICAIADMSRRSMSRRGAR